MLQIIKRFKSLAPGILVFLFLVVFLAWYFVFGIHINTSSPGISLSRNAIWLGHAWVGEELKLNQIPRLVENLHQHDISYAFLHVGPLDPDGFIPQSRFRHARNFLENARKENNQIKYLAWIGRLRSGINLNERLIRENIARTSLSLVNEIGFDGIHVDIEPITDDDDGFFKTLSAIKSALPAERQLLSVAVGKFVPRSLIWFLNLKQYNTSGFFEKLDRSVDQIVVMTYETQLKDPRIYSWFVEQETIYLTNIIRKAELLIGLPTYSYTGPEQEQFPDFHEEAENIVSGLKGVLDGISNIRSDPSHLTGVAIYSEWETDDDEWDVFRTMWLGE